MSIMRKTSTKIVSVIASIALIASAFYAVSSYSSDAMAQDEMTMDPVLAAADYPGEVGKQIGTPVECGECYRPVYVQIPAATPDNPQPSEDGYYYLMAECEHCGVNATMEWYMNASGGTRGDVPDPVGTHTPTPDTDQTCVPGGKPTVSAGPDEVLPGDEIVISAVQLGGSKNDPNGSGFTNFRMDLKLGDDDNAKALTKKFVVIKQGSDVIYNSQNQDNAIGKAGGANNDAYFQFAPEYLMDMPYNGEMYTMEVHYTVTDNKELIKKLSTNSQNQKSLSIANVIFTSDFTDAAGNTYHKEAQGSDNIKVLTPNLETTIYRTNKSAAQIFDAVTYNLEIQNTGGAAARGVTITDEDADGLHSIGILPDECSYTLTKNGTTFAGGQPTISLDGTITISLGSTEIGTNDKIIVSYTITATPEKDEDLEKMINKEKNNQFAKRTVTVSADNALDDVSPDISPFFNLLVPSVSAVWTPSSGSITTFGRVHVVTEFTNDGENGSKLIDPSIEFGNPNIGTIDKDSICVNGTPYTPKSILAELTSGSAYKLEYDLVAPTDYQKSYYDAENLGQIHETVTLKARNLIKNCSSTALIKLLIPQPGITAVVSNTEPSSEDIAEGTEPVHVKITASEIGNRCDLNGAEIIINDSPTKTEPEELDPVIENGRFLNLKVNGSAPENKTVNGNTLTIPVEKISKGANVVVEYDVQLCEGSSINDYENTVQADLQSNGNNAPATIPTDLSINNFPIRDRLYAETYFKVQTPAMRVDQSKTDPAIEITVPDNPAPAPDTPVESDDKSDDKDKTESSDKQSKDAADISTDTTDMVDTADGDKVEAPTTVDLADSPVNIGDTVHFETIFNEDSKTTAKGRDFVLTETIEELVIAPIASGNSAAAAAGVGVPLIGGTDANAPLGTDAFTRSYKPSQLGVEFTDIAKITLKCGKEDVTSQYNIEVNASKDQITVKPKNEGDKHPDMTKIPTTMSFDVKMGSKDNGMPVNYDQIAGQSISVKAESKVSNLSQSVVKQTPTKIAEASIDLKVSADKKEVARGGKVRYTITAENNASESVSAARALVVENNIDSSSADFGYKIDPASMKIDLDGEDLTGTSNAVVSWKDGNIGFAVSVNKDLAQGKKLTVTYDTVTDGIADGAYSQTLSNVVFAASDNAKPVAAMENILYRGVDIPADVLAKSGRLDGGEDGVYLDEPGNPLSQKLGIPLGDNTPIATTGDLLLYMALCVIAGAVAAIVGVTLYRRRR